MLPLRGKKNPVETIAQDVPWLKKYKIFHGLKRGTVMREDRVTENYSTSRFPSKIRSIRRETQEEGDCVSDSRNFQKNKIAKEKTSGEAQQQRLEKRERSRPGKMKGLGTITKFRKKKKGRTGGDSSLAMGRICGTHFRVRKKSRPVSYVGGGAAVTQPHDAFWS